MRLIWSFGSVRPRDHPLKNQAQIIHAAGGNKHSGTRKNTDKHGWIQTQSEGLYRRFSSRFPTALILLYRSSISTIAAGFFRSHSDRSATASRFGIVPETSFSPDILSASRKNRTAKISKTSKKILPGLGGLRGFHPAGATEIEELSAYTASLDCFPDFDEDQNQHGRTYRNGQIHNGHGYRVEDPLCHRHINHSQL